MYHHRLLLNTMVNTIISNNFLTGKDIIRGSE